jgi:hypothetical protein
MQTRLLLSFVLLLLFACKKTDCPTPTTTKADILTSKTWILQKYSKFLNGSTTVFYGKGAPNNQIDFSKDTRNYILDGTTTAISTANGAGYRGTWRLINNETQMELQQTYPSSGVKKTINISSLTENEFIYTENADDGIYTSHYIPQ